MNTLGRAFETLFIREDQLPLTEAGLVDYRLLATDLLNLADRVPPGSRFQWFGMAGGERVVLRVIISAGGVVGIQGACLDSAFSVAMGKALAEIAPTRLEAWDWNDCSPVRLEHSFCEASLLLGLMPLGWDQQELARSLPEYQEDPPRSFTCRRWDGEAFDGKTLLLHWECSRNWGFGDVLQFVRYAPQVKARGGRVVFLAQPQLVDVVSTCPGIDEVISEGDPLPAFDFSLPLMSLPGIFRTSLETIPCGDPYLRVPARVPNRAPLTQALGSRDGRLRIGCAWAGNPSHFRDHERSIPPEEFAGLAKIQGVDWFAFQSGMGDAIPFSGVTPLSPLLSTFADSAFGLSQMDLVISVDTSLVHLAGALGVPCWTLVTYAPDWRWMLRRGDSPWYPTMRLFRQPTPGDWASVIAEVVQAFSEFQRCKGGSA